jgi:DNA-binding response OmpR family regulator
VTIETRAQVMVVDDDLALARMLRILFQSEGYDVVMAHDGQQALDRLATGTPSLVVLDLQMPVLDGRGFYREFRRRGYHSPVLLLSAYNSEAAREELGADASLGKPCDPEQVAGVAKMLINRPHGNGFSPFPSSSPTTL